ncbi:Zn-ribbon domain-containing OB-fold protein [Microvirga alba]|uniref:OB-fold domain-containing protein n=1 Tax=Microvirga alba TaxID=2791025 RepID=A0A931FSM7_9HYPH|nr:OB-fold domain-containing protein [Microvirga alba]MBF9233856.1 OB-fold domain-containing protein [Microvirga alba]
MTERVFIEPQPTSETQTFWEAAKEGRFFIKRCDACEKAHWYPREHCPFCTSMDTKWVEASGEGVIYSFSIMRRAKPPYVMAYVTLSEGPTMMTNLIECDPVALRIGDPVSVAFVETAEGNALPMFKPKAGAVR